MHLIAAATNLAQLNDLGTMVGDFQTPTMVIQ